MNAIGSNIQSHLRVAFFRHKKALHKGGLEKTYWDATYLRDFLGYVKTQLATFGAELDFESDSWNITKEAKRKDRQATVSLHFTGFPSGRGQKDGEFVANRWVAHQSLTLQRLDQLCANVGLDR